MFIFGYVKDQSTLNIYAENFWGFSPITIFLPAMVGGFFANDIYKEIKNKSNASQKTNLFNQNNRQKASFFNSFYKNNTTHYDQKIKISKNTRKKIILKIIFLKK